TEEAARTGHFEDDQRPASAGVRVRGDPVLELPAVPLDQHAVPARLAEPLAAQPQHDLGAAVLAAGVALPGEPDVVGDVPPAGRTAPRVPGGLRAVQPAQPARQPGAPRADAP